MKIKCAVFEYTTEPMKGVRSINKEIDIPYLSDNKVRVSEIIEVDFPDRNKEEIIPEMVAAIDQEIKNEEAASQMKINQLKAKKAELLCIEFKG